MHHLTMGILPILLFVLLGLYVPLFLLLPRYWPLRKVPGPFIASFTNLWRFRIQYFGSLAPTLQELHRRYGPIVRIGPDTVSIGSANYVDLVYSRRGEYKKVGLVLEGSRMPVQLTDVTRLPRTAH